VAEKMTLRLWQPVQAHQAIATAWAECVKPMLLAGHRLVLEVKPETRSNEQNKRLWAMLTDISRQVDWYGQKLSPEDWKHMFTASLKKTRAVPGIDGGIVVLGQSTSKMTKAEMCELQELMSAFAAERGVLLGVDMETGEVK
jgi:hypothetical protein